MYKSKIGFCFLKQEISYTGTRLYKQPSILAVYKNCVHSFSVILKHCHRGLCPMRCNAINSLQLIKKIYFTFISAKLPFSIFFKEGFTKNSNQNYIFCMLLVLSFFRIHVVHLNSPTSWRGVLSGGQTPVATLSGQRASIVSIFCPFWCCGSGCTRVLRWTSSVS